MTLDLSYAGTLRDYRRGLASPDPRTRSDRELDDAQRTAAITLVDRAIAILDASGRTIHSGDLYHEVFDAAADPVVLRTVRGILSGCAPAGLRDPHAWD